MQVAHITDLVALLAAAMESFVNLTSAILGLTMVTIAKRPAADGHPYSHHKGEYFSSGLKGVLIIAAALVIIGAPAHRIFDPQFLPQVGWGLLLSVASSGLNGLLGWLMLRAPPGHTA